MGSSDEALYESFLTRNDNEAIRILFDKYREPLTYFLNGIVHNMDDAEEIMMDCFAIVIAATSRFSAKRGSSLKTWLYAIAAKRARMFLRKNHMTAGFEDGDHMAAGDAALPESGLLQEEKNIELYRAMNALSSDQRTVLYLKFFEDMKPEEISKVLKKNIRQVYSLTDKGKERLRELLTDTEGGAPWNM